MTKPTFWNQGNEFYLPMIRRHAALWKEVERVITERKPQSMLEIGCGSAHLADLVPRYHGIDLNAAELLRNHEVHPKAEFTIGDWLTLDISAFIGKFDMVLACGVIEHCPHWRPFIDRIIAVNPKTALVSFFLSDGCKKEVIRTVERDGCARYYTNRYDLYEITLEFGGNVEWQRLPRAGGIDCLMTLNCR